MRRKRGHKRRLRRRLLWGGLVVAGLLVLALGWLLYKGLKARTELEAVRSIARRLEHQVEAGDISGAQASARQLRHHAAAAHAYASGPLWSVGSAVPYFGDPLDTAGAVAAAADRVAATAVPPTVDALSALGHTDAQSPGVDLQPVVHLLPRVIDASQAVTDAVHDIGRAPGSTWLGSVNDARAEVLDELGPVESVLGSIAQHEPAIRALFGADGPRNYLLAFQNEAELRPAGGGLPGSFAVLHVDDGHFAFSTFRPDSYLAGIPSHGLDLGADFDDLYQGARSHFQDANASPHFPFAAQIWAQVWETKSGTHIDNVVSIDPTTLSYLLAAVGPATTDDGTEVTAGNVVALTEKRLYTQFASSDADRKQFLVGVAKAVANHLLAARTGLRRLTDGVRRAADEHRLLFWSADPAVENWATSGPLGGSVPDDTRPYVAFTLNNDAQSKLDYYLHASLDYSSTCSGDTRQVTATVTIRNETPDGLPPGAIGQSDPAGAADMYVGIYATRDAKFGKVTDHGQLPFSSRGVDRGHPAYLVYAVVPRGGTDVIVYHWTEPARPGALEVRTQPMINPMETKIDYRPCS